MANQTIKQLRDKVKRIDPFYHPELWSRREIGFFLQGYREGKRK